MSHVYIPPLIIEKFGVDVVGVSSTGRDKDYIYKCPECENRGKTPDDSGKLYVRENYDGSVVYHCFRCEYSGLYRAGEGKGYKIAPVRDISELVGLAKSSLYKKTTYTSEYPYRIPFTSALMDPSALEYLLSRGFTQDDIIHYDIRYAGVSDPRLSRRIIIPNKVITKNDGNQYTDMYVARSIDPNESKRYINPFGKNKTNIVFNLHRIPEGSPIVISEGSLSAMSIGKYAVATYGKSVSDYQIKLIINNNPSAIYVGLDSDAMDESIQLCERLQKRTMSPIYLIEYPDGIDSNDILSMHGKEYLHNYVASSKLYSGLLTKSRLLLDRRL